MKFLTIVTIAFLVLESSNVILLYFFPEFKYGNTVGFFKAWEKSKADPQIHDLVKYLTNWVAGTKLIILALLIVILIAADDDTLLYASIALPLSIASFFWRLFPLIRKMDREGQIKPPNYSLTLGLMIYLIIMLFVIAAIFAFAG
jgi:hypothetical protein